MPRSIQDVSLWFAAVTALSVIAAIVVGNAQQPAFQSLAPIFSAAAAGLIIAWIIVVRWFNHDLTRQWPRWLWRFVLLFAAIIISFLATDINFNALEGDRAGQLASTVLWMGAVVLALAAAWRRHEAPTESTAEPMTRTEVIVLIALVALAFVLRVFDLDHIPGLILGDETKYTVAARDLLELQQLKPFTTGADGHWNFYLQIIGLFIRLFGPTMLAMRLSSVIAGTLSIIATYAVVREVWGRRAALIVAALLATFHHHLHYSRVGFNSIDDPLFSMLIFACVWLAWRSGRRRAWLMTALATGLSQYFFVGGRLVLIQLAALAVFWLIADRARVRAQALNIALAVSVFLCIVTPSIYYIAIRPDEYMGSLNAKNIYRSHWVEAQMEVMQQTEGEVLWAQLHDVLKSFSFGSDEAFYWSQTILTPIMSVLAAIGLAYFIARLRQGPYFWVISALALLILFGGILMVSPTAGSHRLLGSGPLIYITIAVILDRAWGWYERRVSRRRLTLFAGVFIIALLMLADANYYFVNYLTRNELRAPDVTGNVIHRYLLALDQRTTGQPLDIRCVQLNTDFCRGTNIDYLARSLVTRAQIVSDIPGIADVPPPPGDRLQVVIINASFSDEVERARQRYATLLPLNLENPQGAVLFVVYEIYPQ
ncbi:MAG: glycosyltransferase family 39 protein [Chloroflexi bacterium]|nr:glycosyltransferase family 39 protein [Chloroflexota bacterium]